MVPVVPVTLMAPTKFNFNARSVFLTYPKADFDLEEFKNHVEKTFPLKYALVSSEEHQDGSLHRHAVLGFTERVHTRRHDFFDYSGFHPNIQTPRRVKDVISYCKKDGTFLKVGELPGDEKINWEELLSSSKSSEDFITRVRERDTLFCVRNFSNIERFAKWSFRTTRQDYTSDYCGFNVCYQLTDFHSRLLSPRFSGERVKGLVLRGPTRLGKTSWARSLGVHTYWNGGIDWSKHLETDLYCVIDDIPLEMIPRKQQLFGCQFDITVSQKYKPLMNYRWGIPVIYLTNDPSYLEKESDYFKVWWEGNMTIVDIDKPLFLENSK
jgi:hypothetical protein